ncbi:sensor histidine kinase [Dactylosporangium sp. CA-092794]|uniref:sensor histidine kinase n=1 Tax=Dactylosporangium sp. CA-092794 TaxID=3239929 RepID=UPI003D8DD07D
MPPTPPSRRSPPRFFWMWTAVWLFYMAGPFLDAWHRPETWQRVVGLLAAAGFCALYLDTFRAARQQMRTTGAGLVLPWTVVRLAGMVALAAILTLIVGESGLTTLVYIGVVSVFSFPARAAMGIVSGAGLTAFVLPRVVPGWDSGVDLTFAVLVAALAVWGVTRVVQRNAQLAAAREEITRLAIDAERNRFARDLHDLLGHSLTVVSVKSELAARLVQLAPDRAEAELADIQRLVREALVDVRAAVAGYRAMSLSNELASARSALDAAGIEADVPVTGEAVDPGRQELFAWVVREGVTNVVRHSEAKHCWIRLDHDAVEISDDGRGPAPAAQPPTPTAGHGTAGHGTVGQGTASHSTVGQGTSGHTTVGQGTAGHSTSGQSTAGHGTAGHGLTGHGLVNHGLTGHGLAGLRERLDAAGCTLTVGRRDGGGFLLRATAPAAPG